MQWLNNFLFLLCPLMMIFCMKGLFGGHHKHQSNSHSTNDLDHKVLLLETENQKLRKEIENLAMIVKKES